MEKELNLHASYHGFNLLGLRKEIDLYSEEEDVLVKERVAHREREGRASRVLERFYYIFIFIFIF